MSPLLANIALSVLDEHLHGPWKPGGSMATGVLREKRRRHQLPNWRIVRYADDFVVLVHDDETDMAAIRDDVAAVLAPIGLRLSPAKTRIVHMNEGFDFLGFRIQWRRKKGTNKWYVYTFIGDRPIRSVETKIRALTHRLSQMDLEYVLDRLNSITYGWANYFRHAVAKNVFSMLDSFTWWRLMRMLMHRYRWKWTEVRRRHVTPEGHWLPITAGTVERRLIARVPVTRYRWRGTKIPTPYPFIEPT